MCMENKDHCGPQVVNLRTWLLSFLIPDDLWGVYIGDLCKLHDEGYEDGGDHNDRLARDREFRRAVFQRIDRKLGGTVEAYCKARLAATLYYIGVRKGGRKQFNFK